MKAPKDEKMKMIQKQQTNPAVPLRFALPLTVPESNSNLPQEVKSVGNAKTWVIDKSTVFLHPEYLAPHNQWTEFKFEFAAVNPHFQGQGYTNAYGIGFEGEESQTKTQILC